MIKDIFFSLKDNVKQKTTNPFFGTLIIVWIIHNWKLIFTFFNFENGETLKAKIEFISNYLEPRPFVSNIGVCILITFVVLIGTYFFLNLSRLIVNTFEKRLTPWVYKITDNKSIVLKSRYEKLEKERDLLSQKLDLEREAKLRLQNEISGLEEKLKMLIVKPIENIDPEKKIKEESENLDNRIFQIINDIEKNNYSHLFENIIDDINNSEYIPFLKFQNVLNYFMRIGIIELDKNAKNDIESKKYIFTDFGKIVKDKFINVKMKEK